MTVYLVISVDLETPQTPLRQGLLRAECLDPVIGETTYGYSYILRVLDRFQVPGVFFVNVYEAALWGDKRLQQICKDIYETGSEIGLHTHPEWRYDPTRIHMWQYSREEQIQIITDGLKLIQQWLPGYQVISHRAGAYGINEDTIESLRLVNIPVDSSMFYGHPNCKAIWRKNQMAASQGILEIPVTGYERHRHVTFGGITVHSQQTFSKTDVNWASLDELLFFLEEAKRNDIRVFNLFMHSYSFVRFNSDSTHLEPNHPEMEKFEQFLALALSDPEIRVVTMRDLYELCRQDTNSLLGGADYVPVYRQKTRLRDQARQVLRRRWESLW